MDTLLARQPQEKQLTSCADSFFFMSPYRSFSTSGCFTRLDCPALDGENLNGGLQKQLREAFENAKKHGIEKPVAVGAIPFDPRQPSALFIPESWQTFSRAQRQIDSSQCGAAQPLNIAARKAVPEQEKFMAMVAHAAAATTQPDIDKVVLSRLIDIETDAPVDLDALLNRLISQNPTSYNFHVPLADGSSLVGASPELLLRKSGKNFSSLPLAGSARRDKDNIQRDSEIGAQLLRSTKDRHEHGLVTQAMRDVLQPHSQYLTLSDTPELITTPTLWHLATPIYGQVEDQQRQRAFACLPAAPNPGVERFPARCGAKINCRTGTVRPRTVWRHRRLV